jgi:hypothetical protein
MHLIVVLEERKILRIHGTQTTLALRVSRNLWTLLKKRGTRTMRFSVRKEV